LLAAAVANSAPVPHTPDQHFWWYAGLAIGSAVVVGVVMVVATILALAARIGAQARAGIDLMDRACRPTLPVWQVQKTNTLLTGICQAAQSARECLERARTGWPR
jgi:hypothetical protein